MRAFLIGVALGAAGGAIWVITWAIVAVTSDIEHGTM